MTVKAMWDIMSLCILVFVSIHTKYGKEALRVNHSLFSMPAELHQALLAIWRMRPITSPAISFHTVAMYFILALPRGSYSNF